jgi:hypothetical protein
VTPESWTIALRGAVVAALSFTPLALAAAAAAGWFRGGSATADTGALLLLAPLVLGILLTVIATGAVLAALAGAAAAVLASRPGGTVPSIGLALVAGIVGAAIGASSSFAGTDTLQGAHPGVVGAVLWGLPVLLAALTVRTRPSDAPVRRKPAPRPVPAASPATPSVPTNPSVGAGRVPASPGPIDSAIGTTTNRTIPPPRWPAGRRPAQRAPLLQGRTVPLVVLSAGGAAITGGLLMASPDLALGTPLGWCLQPWLALGTAGMFDADRLIDPTRIVLAGAVGAAINLPLAYLGAVALSRRR